MCRPRSKLRASSTYILASIILCKLESQYYDKVAF